MVGRGIRKGGFWLLVCPGSLAYYYWVVAQLDRRVHDGVSTPIRVPSRELALGGIFARGALH